MIAMPTNFYHDAGRALERCDRLLASLAAVDGVRAILAGIDIAGVGRIHIHHGVVGDAESPAKADALYQIGSQTKTLVAMTLVALARDGRFDLDALARDFVDLPIDERISVRHLLMNSSGLGEYSFALPPERYDPRILYSPRDLVSLAFPQGQLFAPGAYFDYCNTGWVIAGMIAEAVSGERLEAVVRRYVLEPLECLRTWFARSPDNEPMLQGYIQSPATGGKVASAHCLSWAFGAGDAISCLDDMLTVYGSLCAPNSPTGISLDILTEQLLGPSPRPYFALSAGTEYGLGIERRCYAGSEVWGHPGATLSYLSGSWVDPAFGVSISSCLTRSVELPLAGDSEALYPRAQIFSALLSTAYSIAETVRA